MNSAESNEDQDLEKEPEEQGLRGFERKYKSQMRQIVTQKLDLPISTLPAMLADQIKLNPEFQRRDRWDVLRQSRLIESLLMNVPIPPIFLGEDDYGFYVVLDGRQRLTAIKNFLNNSLRLEGLEVWDDLNGKTYQDLVDRGLDKHLTRRFLPAIALLRESSPAIKYDVFDRLNTGGVKANEMEIRNAVFRGPFTDHLHMLSRLPEFCDLWEIPKDELEAKNNALYQQMEDLSIVLRFFALIDPDKVGSPFKDYLGEFMESRNNEYIKNPNLAKSDQTKLENATKNCLKIFGQSAFRNPSKQGKGKRSLPIAEAVLVALADLPPTTITDDVVKRIQTSFAALCEDPVFSKSITSGTNGKGAIKTRISMTREAFLKCIES
jgi:Protein of unknown function DUF262.